MSAVKDRETEATIAECRTNYIQAYQAFAKTFVDYSTQQTEDPTLADKLANLQREQEQAFQNWFAVDQTAKKIRGSI